jgi:hypothetical protein
MGDTVLPCPDLLTHCREASSRKILGTLSCGGPTRGILQCGACSAEYVFNLLDRGGGPGGDDVRVFSLHPVPAGSLDALTEICFGSLGPDWPVWVPQWKFAAADEQAAARRRMSAILDRAGAPEWTIAWKGGWAETIVAAKRLSAKDAREVETALGTGPGEGGGRDWFAFLGLPKPG